VNRTVLITGSTRGIGLAAAAEFLNNGDRVVIFCRHERHLKDASDYLLTFGKKENILALAGDVQNGKDVIRIITRSLQQFQSLDVLVNNAGTAVYKPIKETTEKDWDLIINTNLKGSFLFSREVVPVMRRQGKGIIINVASGLGIEGAANFSAYCASKFGVIGLTRALADETALLGIRVYAILPGSVDTTLVKKEEISFDSELSQMLAEDPTAHVPKTWVYATFPNMGTDPSELMSPEHIARQIVKIAKGEKKTGALVAVYS